MKYPRSILATLIILTGLLLGLLLQDDLFYHRVISVCALMILIPLLVLLFGGVLANRMLKRKVGKVLRYAITIVGSSILAVVVFGVTSDSLDAWKNKAVAAYVGCAVPILDDYKASHGTYPTTLPISMLGEPPELLRKYGSYSSDGSEYRFEYIDEPAGWAGGAGMSEFTSTQRKWADE